MGIGFIGSDHPERVGLVVGSPEHPGFFFSPVWSPDGRQIAFLSDMYADQSVDGPYIYRQDVYVINADGTDLRRLTNDRFFKNGLSWSPDGARLVFSAFEYGKPGDLFLIDANGEELRRLTDTPEIKEDFPAWSPDGSKIAFREEGIDFKSGYLTWIDSTGQNRTRITDFLAGYSNLAWSPDGRKIAFQSFASAYCGDIYTVNIDGSELTQITRIGGALDPTWSPTGTHIAFIASGCNSGQGDTSIIRQRIYLVDSSGGGPARMPAQFPSDCRIEDLHWSPVPYLQAGSEYTITKAGDSLHLRQSASLRGKIITRLKAGDAITVLEGPTQADGYYWWKVRSSADQEGWVVDVMRWYQ